MKVCLIYLVELDIRLFLAVCFVLFHAFKDADCILLQGCMKMSPHPSLSDGWGSLFKYDHRPKHVCICNPPHCLLLSHHLSLMSRVLCRNKTALNYEIVALRWSWHGWCNRGSLLLFFWIKTCETSIGMLMYTCLGLWPYFNNDAHKSLKLGWGDIFIHYYTSYKNVYLQFLP
jgi:hypothetical protein